MILIPLTVLLAAVTVALSQSCPATSRSITFKFGNLNGTIVSDGPVMSVQRFFANIPQQAVIRSARANCYPLPPSFGQNIPILDTPSGRIMIDTGAFNTGFPGFENGGQLFTNLDAAGISTSSIDAIFITHGHGDHVGGLVDRKGRRAFQNAKVYVGKVEHEYWTADPFVNTSPRFDNDLAELLAKIYKRSVTPYEKHGNLMLVKGNSSPLPGIKLISTPGHSVGHLAVQVSSAGKRLLVAGDSILTKIDQVQNPTWAHVAESNSSQAYTTRVRLMERASRKRALVLVYHERFPGLGYIKQVGAAFDWVDAGREELQIGTYRSC